CDGNVSNGCETNLNTTVTSCGSCTNSCSYANAAATCFSGTCQIGACNPLFANCDGNAANGCEKSLTTLTDCGACGAPCAPANASASCASGTCTLGTCNAGFGNCDGIASNGCEVNTQTNALNCDTCGYACNGTDGTASWALGGCSVACNAGFGNCDGLVSTGCEASLNTISNCGA